MTGIDGRDPGGVRPLYGRFAWAYDLVVARPAGGSAEHVAKMLLSSGASPGSRVVDAGCGTGRYADGLAASGFRVVGVDRSEALIEQARARSTSAVFVCAELLAWRPPEMADAVLCRGVLNDLTADSDRRAAFGAFASWLCPGGLLLADVREWEATATRYAQEPRHEHSVGRPERTLDFSSETTLDSSRRLMHVHEHYTGTVEDLRGPAPGAHVAGRRLRRQRRERRRGTARLPDRPAAPRKVTSHNQLDRGLWFSGRLRRHAGRGRRAPARATLSRALSLSPRSQVEDEHESRRPAPGAGRVCPNVHKLATEEKHR